MRFRRLEDWLSWQEQLHFTAVDPGLERVQEVYCRLFPGAPDFTVVTIAGTNGKGSTAAFLESMLDAAGHRVGCYSSPHLIDYNERIRVARQPADDAAIMAAFDTIDRCRDGVSLTYFEFGTLAALEIFRREAIDVAVLEVGMGGRLDAVNVVAPDVAVITPVGVDHARYLGHDRESVAQEKAGILRPGHPAVCTDPAPPKALCAHAESVGAPLARIGHDFGWSPCRDGGWRWWSRRAGVMSSERLPEPLMAGQYQLDNAAGALEAAAALPDSLQVPHPAAAWGIARARVPGRLEIWPGPVPVVLDVAHNPAAAAVLAETLANTPVEGRTLGVMGMVADKDHAGVLRALAGALDAVWCCDLDASRGLPGATLAGLSRDLLPGVPVHTASDPVTGLTEARSAAAPGDRVVVFGSFLTVGAILEAQPAAPAPMGIG